MDLQLWYFTKIEPYVVFNNKIVKNDMRIMKNAQELIYIYNI